MITPSPAEILAIRAACGRRFGAVRPLLVRLEHPIDAAVVVASFDLASFSAHVDAAKANPSTATNNIPIARLLWCSPVPYAPSAEAPVPWYDGLVKVGDLGAVEVPAGQQDADPLRTVSAARFEALREAWPVTCSEVEVYMRIPAGAGLTAHPAQQLTASNAPPGFPKDTVAPTHGPGALWVASWSPGGLWLAAWGPGATLVMRQPLPDVWNAGRALWGAALSKGEGLVAASMRFAAEHVVWASEPVAQLWDRLPDVAVELRDPFFAMGGHGVTSSAAFL